MNHKRHELERWVSRKPRREYLSLRLRFYIVVPAQTAAARPALGGYRRYIVARRRRGDAFNFVFIKIILDLIWGLEGDTVAGVDGGLGVPTIETIDT